MRSRRKLLIVDARAITDDVEVLAHLAQLDDDGVLELAEVPPAQRARWAEVLRGAGGLVDDAVQGVLRVGRLPVPALVDLTRMEPPEPLERTLLAAETLAPGARWCARYPHYPVHLPPRLAQRTVEFELATRPDGSGILWMRRR